MILRKMVRVILGLTLLHHVATESTVKQRDTSVVWIIINHASQCGQTKMQKEIVKQVMHAHHPIHPE